MKYKINYFHKVEKDLLKIDTKKVWAINRFIELKLSENPINLGKNLHGKLKVFLSAKVADYRIIYSVKNKNITIFIIAHRKQVYDKAKRRLLG